MKATNLVGKELGEMATLISYIEAEQRGIPVLLRQYLQLGGKLLGFNQDSHFGDVVDGPVLVDLTQTDPWVLERYMGKPGTTTFLTHQRQPLLGQVS